MRRKDTVRSVSMRRKKALMFYCIGLCCDYMADAAKKAGMKEVYYLETQEEFWEKGLPTLKAGDTILLKASRSREFEKTVAKLQGVN